MKKLNLEQLELECDVIDQAELNAIKGGDWITDFFNTHGQGIYTSADWGNSNAPHVPIAVGGTSFDINAFSNLVFHSGATPADGNSGAADNNYTNSIFAALDDYNDQYYTGSSSGGYGDYGDSGGYGGYSAGGGLALGVPAGFNWDTKLGGYAPDFTPGVLGGGSTEDDELKKLAQGSVLLNLVTIHASRLPASESTWQKVKDYISNVGTAGSMTAGWFLGIGQDSRNFIEDNVTNALRTSEGIALARADYYLSHKTHFDYNFDALGVYEAGLNPIQQFVGSFSVDMAEVNGRLQFTVHNTTSLGSAAYHLIPYSWNPPAGSGPMGNFDQTYQFSEKLVPESLLP